MSSDRKTRKNFEDEALAVFKPNPKFDAARTQANMELVGLLGQFLVENPSLRFGQALNSLGLLDDAKLVEPQVQLKRAQKIIRRMNAKDQKA